MDLNDEEERDPTLYEQISAYVFSLVAAIGGSSAEEDGRYQAGEEALQCLRDIRKVITAYDIKPNRLDVARACAESNLVKGDLLEILAQWNGDENRGVSQRTVIASLEILVHLTWPFELEPEDMTVNHHKHLPYLQLTQSEYKRAILHHTSSRVLNAAIRAALPSMAESRKDRSIRDESIIKILLCLLRNVVEIQHPFKNSTDFEDAEVSRSATIDAFHQQDVFQVLLTIGSSIGDEFTSQDVILLETLFHLLKGVNVEKLFMEERKLTSENTKDFKSLLNKEKAMLAGYARHAPSRHNRFGTMIWVKRDDHKMSTVSGQDVLGNAQKSIQKMDKTKKWNKPKFKGKKTEGAEKEHTEFDIQTHLDSTARKNLRAFVEDFLDSSFNPLFTHLRKAIEREESRVERRHGAQFFYVSSWFLQAECLRRRKIREARERAKGTNSSANQDDENYGLIAGVMTQETFVLLNRFMQRSQDDKSWTDLKAGMKAFTQILLTVQEMSDSPLEDDQDIAENIQNRIFYEESTHDRIITMLRTYKQQGFAYLDAITELSHVFLRMLERYSKQNVDLQVRSKRRARKKKRQVEGDAIDDADAGRPDRAEEAEDVVEAQRTVTERKFDFNRFAARFMQQGCVDTFIAFLRFYNDLDAEQLKRGHRFLYRLAFKMEMTMILYRVDILHLFNKMIKGPEGLHSDQPYFKEWEELVKQVFRRGIKKLQERPELVVEMLFTKINATIYYLEHGHEKETITRAPRAPAELEVKPGMEKPEQIGVAVSVLLNQNKADALQWVKDVLSSAAEDRKSWEDAEVARKAMARTTTDELDELLEEDATPAQPDPHSQAPSITLTPDNEERRISLFKDNKLRLLLTLLGFERTSALDDPHAIWSIPSTLSAADLSTSLDTVRKFERDPPSFDDGTTAESLLRSKAAARRRRAEFDDESDGGSQDEEFLFPAGGPTTIEKSEAALEHLKKTHKRKQRQSSNNEVDGEELDRRAKARREAELAKRRKIKSEMYVRDDDTDDEADEEFFRREAELRERTKQNIHKALTTGTSLEVVSKKRKQKEHGSREKTKRRKSTPLSNTGSEDSDPSEGTPSDVESIASSASAVSTAASRNSNSPARHAASPKSKPSQKRKLVRKPQRRGPFLVDSSDEDEGQQSDTPMSSMPAMNTDEDEENGIISEKLAPVSDVARGDVEAVEDEDDEDVMVQKRAGTRRGMRGGFIIDSDSE